jgi:RNA polymerase sigma factor (sigma-70 family)
MPSQLVDAAIEKELSARARQDLTLVQAALAGQAKAYEALWQHYRKPVFYLVLKLVPDADDAEDLTMETLARAFRHLPAYTPAFAFSTWLFRIATNASIDFLRRKRLATSSFSSPEAGSSHEEEDQAAHKTHTPEPDPLEACIQQQRREWVHQVVARLPAKYVALVRLRYFEERSYEEIAKELRLPLGTVKAFLSKSRELLLALLKNSPHTR